MQFKTLFIGLAIMVYELNLKRSYKIFSQETMAAGENFFALELNEKEVIELLENGTLGSVKKATKYGMKIFQGKNLPKV